MHIIKLRYEILNTSLEELAVELAIPLGSLIAEAKRCNWAHRWPDSLLDIECSSGTADSLLPSLASSPGHAGEDVAVTESDDEEDFFNSDEEESPMESECKATIKDLNLRLQVFSLEKDAYLASKYAAFESTLLDTATHTAANTDMSAQGIRQLASVVKDLAYNRIDMNTHVEDGGLPTVIIRDLRGKQ